MASEPFLVIRPATAGDLDGIMRIEQRAFPTPWSHAVMLSELARTGACYLAAELDGCLVGYAGVSCYAGEAHIMTIAVAPERQRRGIGRALLLELLRRALHAGAQLAYLEYRPSNVAAGTLYEDLGFRRVGSRPNYYRDTGEDAILMTLDELPERWTGQLAACLEEWGRRHGCSLEIR